MPSLNSQLSIIPRIQKKYLPLLEKLGIKTVQDFLLYLPFRYEDYSEQVAIENLEKGQQATVIGEIFRSKLTRTWKKKMMIVECLIKDETGVIKAVWFNQPFIADSLSEGKGIRISGKVSAEKKNGELYFSNPSFEFSSREPTNTGRLVPIYPETEGITSKWMRWQIGLLIKYASNLTDPIPEHILKELHLPALKDAIMLAHFPKKIEEAELAQKRFAFEQIFAMQLSSESLRNSWQKNKAPQIPFDENLVKKFVSSLTFSLTGAQKKASFQIYKDMEKSIPMNRLLNGDVGSGKTMVAQMSALEAMHAGYQVAIMAPTEVLAKQHFESFCKIFKDYNFGIALLTNSYRQKNFEFPISNFESNQNDKISKIETVNIQSKFKIQNSKLDKSNKKENESEKRASLLQEIKLGNIDIIIGTHALIQKDVAFGKLGLVIIDEQHRFGVTQRATLLKSSEKINDGLPETMPHFLTMTATPIPRTMAMTFFGNLDISILDEMPKNRKPIKTKLISPRERGGMYEFIRKEAQSGRQTFVILPLVEESEKLIDIKAAVAEHKRLSESIFPDLKLALLHGKMSAKEKESVMQDFRDKKYDILVATSVIEVGIDIPNATTIVIEDADRFGLAQLHQFRGRVGRGEHQSYCFLLTESATAKSKSRLAILEKYSSGFDVAEKDFALRGPGEFLGTRQSGIGDLAMQHLGNTRLIAIASDYAKKMIGESPNLEKYPLLKKEIEKFKQNVHLE